MSEKKKRLLGMPYGTAQHRLRKSIMFSLARRLDACWCYQCGGEIVSVEEFSVEHKKPWESVADPAAAFFDLDNIAFSHHSCNSGAASRPHKIHANQKAGDKAYQDRRRKTQAWRDTVARRREKRRLARLGRVA